ncbi:MAG: hypothetical protein HY056_08825 [Proteobacteria bacterium]|nr:hypothetical protein [Pseudomonadota bacterium]
MRLLAADARHAYPFVQFFHPEVTLSQWLKFVRPFAAASEQNKGVVTVRDRRRYIHAAFAYFVERPLAQWPILRIDELMVGRLPGRLLNDAVLAAIVGTARGLRCARIQVAGSSAWHDRADAATLAYLIKSGFRPSAPPLTRSIDRPLPSASLSA